MLALALKLSFYKLLFSLLFSPVSIDYISTIYTNVRSKQIHLQPKITERPALIKTLALCGACLRCVHPLFAWLGNETLLQVVASTVRVSRTVSG